MDSQVITSTHQHLWYHGTNRLLLRQEALTDHPDRKYYMKLTAFHELYSRGVQYHFDLNKSRCRLYMLIKAQAAQGKVVITSPYLPTELWGNDPIVHMFQVQEVNSSTTVIEETDAHRDKRLKTAFANRVKWDLDNVDADDEAQALFDKLELAKFAAWAKNEPYDVQPNVKALSNLKKRKLTGL